MPDGIAPIWLARLHGHRNVDRAPGTEIMSEFLKRAHQKGYSSYFYGDTEETLAALCEKVGRESPGHRIAGAYSPPFRPLTQSEEAEIVARINAARPDVLWVALGMPKQDIWIHERLRGSMCRSPSVSAQPSPLSPAPSPAVRSGWAARALNGSTASSRSPANSGVAICSTAPVSSFMQGWISSGNANRDPLRIAAALMPVEVLMRVDWC